MRPAYFGRFFAQNCDLMYGEPQEDFLSVSGVKFFSFDQNTKKPLPV